MVQNAETACSKYGDFLLEHHAKYIKVICSNAECSCVCSKAETFMHVAIQNLQHGCHTQITAGQHTILIKYVRPLSEV